MRARAIGLTTRGTPRIRAMQGEGETDAKFLLRTSKALARAVRKDAKARGVSMTEWYKRAAEYYLTRPPGLP